MSQPVTTAAATGGPADFDFLMGRWQVRNRRRRQWLAGCHDWEEFDATCEARPSLDGLGHRRVPHRPLRRFTGMSLRLFHPGTGQWSIYWASTRRPGVLEPPVTGAFAGDTGTFDGADTFDGRPVLVRFLWSGVTTPAPRWEQAFSADNGQTWESQLGDGLHPRLTGFLVPRSPARSPCTRAGTRRRGTRQLRHPARRGAIETNNGIILNCDADRWCGWRRGMESIERFVIGQLAAWEVPGCAIAAVRDGAVVLAGGWGRRDLAADLPVTPDTLFAIGSTTKAFTAATVGALVEDGLLDGMNLATSPTSSRSCSFSDPDGDITALTVPFEPSVEALRFDRLPDAPALDPEVLRPLCGTYTMGPIEVTVTQKADRLLTIAAPGAPPFELRAGRGLRFEVTGQPGLTIEFELDETGAVAWLVAQPLGIFHPKALSGPSAGP